MSAIWDLAAVVADRLAVNDVVIRYFQLVDAKGWDHMHEVFTEDTTARWTPDALMEGRARVVGAMQHMVGGDEVVTFHHVASMAPVIDGDTATVEVRVRAMHNGIGPRAGKFYESLAVQPTRLVRTPEGWRISASRLVDRGEARKHGRAVRARARVGHAALAAPGPDVLVHPRLSVNSVSSYMQPLAADIAMWQDLGVEHVALILPKIEEVGWDAAREMVTTAGLRVSTIFGPTYKRLDADRSLGWWDADQTGTVDTVEFAASIGAESVYVCSGAAPTLTWDEGADAFCELVAPAVARGAELGIPLLLEPTNPLRSDISIIFWQRDAMDLARRAGTKVVLDFQSSWYERGLEQVVRDNIDLIGLTQISDYVIGTTETGNRVVPGDGDIPLERLLAMVLDAGFEGSFDLEVMGPRVEEEGYPSSVRRSVERASALLDRVGA